MQAEKREDDKGDIMKIAYIDNYDSFAYNIVAYLEQEGAEVNVYKSDEQINIQEDIIVLGPGPNGPKESGYLPIIERYKHKPIFGICLGFQALMEYFGEEVVPLDETVHGSASMIEHDNKTIFRNITDATFARYHSLGVHNVPEDFIRSATVNNIVMAARHKTLKIEGVQFHPESILSVEGRKLLRNMLEVFG